MDAAVHVEGDTDADLATKLSLLERLVELARFELDLDPFGPATRGVSLEDAAEMDVRSTLAGLHLTPEVHGGMPQPKVPTDLQASLLVFLLLQRASLAPIQTIERFLQTLRPHLSPLDAERTATGKQRASTNTHFAARALRDYGLLRYTQEEAFKRWALSPLGSLVAVRLYSHDWASDLIGHGERSLPGLHPRIGSVLHGLRHARGFAESVGLALESLGHVNPLETYADAVQRGFALVQSGLEPVLTADEDATKAERQEAAQRLSEALDRIEKLRALLDDARLDEHGRQRLDALHDRLDSGTDR